LKACSTNEKHEGRVSNSEEKNTITEAEALLEIARSVYHLSERIERSTFLMHSLVRSLIEKPAKGNNNVPKNSTGQGRSRPK
jgi:hypothetical protein